MPTAGSLRRSPSLTTLGDELVDLGSAASDSQHRLVELAARFEASDEWLVAGAPTAGHWIADQLDICVSTAREWIRVGRALATLPCIEAALVDRMISYAKVRTLTRLATPENETELLEIARSVPAGHLGRALAAWSQANENPDRRDARHRRERCLRWRVEPDGTIAGAFRLPPEQGAALMAAVDAEVMSLSTQGRSPDVDRRDAQSGHHASAGAWPTLAQQRSDALVALATGGGASLSAEVVVHIRGEGCSFDDGTPVADSVVERVAPTAFLRALIHDAGGRPINASSRRRHPTTRQKRVVKERDRVCRDCGGSDLLEFDHVPAYDVTRHTVVDELQLRCAPCHRRRHERS